MGTNDVKLIPAKIKLPQMHYNVGIYCRVSSHFQEQLFSIANQASFFVKMVNTRNDWILTDIYLDFSSGSSTQTRPEFKRMLDDARNNKLDIILTKSISRFGRNALETLQTLRELKECNVTVIFDQEKINTSREDSELMVSIISAIAEGENTSRRENQQWAIKKRLEDGTSGIYTRACFGYKKNDLGELVIDKTEGEIVQSIFDMYLSGKSIIGIISELERQGIKSPTGKNKWCKRTIDTILSNEKYMGDVIAIKTYSVYTPAHKRISNKDQAKTQYRLSEAHDAIISKEMFDAVQAEKARRSNVVVDDSGKQHRKANRYSSK